MEYGDVFKNEMELIRLQFFVSRTIRKGVLHVKDILSGSGLSLVTSYRQWYGWRGKWFYPDTVITPASEHVIFCHAGPRIASGAGFDPASSPVLIPALVGMTALTYIVVGVIS